MGKSTDRRRTNNHRLEFKRKIRKKTVLRIIREHAPVSAPDIARYSGFNIPTTMNIIRELLTENYIKVVGRAPSSGGRPPALYDIQENSYFVIGVDVGRSFINMLVVDIRDRIVSERSIPNRTCEDAREFMQFLISEIEQLIELPGIDPGQIIGMGVALPGPINYHDGVALQLCGAENFRVQEALAYHFNLPVYIENDARAMALGELWYGKARGLQNAVCLNLGWGIGMGLIINGDIYRGSSEFAGEFGHIVVEPEGPLCHCGKRGCLESLASGTALARRAREEIRQGKVRTVLADWFQDKLDQLQTEDIARAAREGDAYSQQLLELAGHYIGRTMAMVVNLINPEKIIIGGRVSLAGDFLLQPLKSAIAEYALPFMMEKMSIELSDITHFSGALGAVSLVKRELYDVSRLNVVSYI